MTVAIQLLGLSAGGPSPVDGHYVVEYDANGPDSPGLNCRLETTPDRAQAKEFASFADAHIAWVQVDQRNPRRLDGKPNRPLTAFNVEIA